MAGTPLMRTQTFTEGVAVYNIMLRIGTGQGLCIATGEGVVLFQVLSHRMELDSFTAMLRVGW